LKRAFPITSLEEYGLGRYFGTDGIRGVAGVDLTPQLSTAAAAAAAKVLGKGRGHVVIGADTRLSSDMISYAAAAGLAAQGLDAWMAGIIPTPAVAMLAAKTGAHFGIVISASHNPHEYNGIKLFGPDGYKLPDSTEDAVEEVLERMLAGAEPLCAGRDRIGKIIDYSEGQAVYGDFAASSVKGSLKGLKVALDCANGAASYIAPDAFRRLGAEVIAINDKPDGLNINTHCGATSPDGLAEAVKKLGCDLGFAFDGDADRSIMADELGNVLDGDFEMAMLARSMKEAGKLGGSAVVATPYSNMGFAEALENLGLKQLTAGNGDRYVLEMMREKGLTLGGEQSGHILLLDMATTGDGLLTALRLAALVKSDGRRTSEIASLMRKYPQGQKAVKVTNKDRLAGNAPIAEAIKWAEQELHGKGRVFVRASGTEPVVRIMVEAADGKSVDAILKRLAEVVEKQLS